MFEYMCVCMRNTQPYRISRPLDVQGTRSVFLEQQWLSAMACRVEEIRDVLKLVAREEGLHRVFHILKTQSLESYSERPSPPQCSREARLVPWREEASSVYKPCGMSWADAFVCFAHICASALEEWDTAGMFPPLAWLGLEWHGVDRFKADCQLSARFDESGKVSLWRILPCAQAYSVAFAHEGAGGSWEGRKATIVSVLRGVSVEALSQASAPEEATDQAGTFCWQAMSRGGSASRDEDLTKPSRDCAARACLSDLLSVDAARTKRFLYGWQIRPIGMRDYSRSEVPCVPTKPMLFCPLYI
jgi:hypothetical protein